jgi:uncharacterized protein YwgA
MSKLARLAFVIRRSGIGAGEILSNDSLEARIRVQKAVYFLKRLGFDLGYEFSLYYHGPYSPELAYDYYSLAKRGDWEIDELVALCKAGETCNDEMGKINELNKWDTTALDVELVPYL